MIERVEYYETDEKGNARLVGEEKYEVPAPPIAVDVSSRLTMHLVLCGVIDPKVGADVLGCSCEDLEREAKCYAAAVAIAEAATTEGASK